MKEFDYTKEPGRSLQNREPDCSGKPLVSIITPYYNAGRYFEQTFYCVMNQTFPWFEWVIVDDGSTDSDSKRLLPSLAKKDIRIRVIYSEHAGPGAARNKAMRETNSDIIVPLDADDLIRPTYIEIIYWALKCNKGYDWTYSNSVGFGNSNYLWNVRFEAGRLKKENFLNCSAGIRKEAIVKVQGYGEDHTDCYEDWLFWIKLLCAGMKPVKTANYGFWYRRTSQGEMAAKDNSHAMERTKSLIREYTKGAPLKVRAKEYPYHAGAGAYRTPKVSDWNRKTFVTHDKLHVLLLLPWLEMGGADIFNLTILERLDKSRFEIGVITTQEGENTWQQRFEDHVADLFHLPDFLDVKDYAEFISYYILSREVDVLFLSNSYFGYCLLPWLRKEFPQLAIVDYVHMEEWYWRNGGYARLSGVMGGLLEKTYVCNEHTRQVLIEEFGRKPDRVETLYIGVDSRKYDPGKVEPGLAKAVLGVELDRQLILFPCRVHPQKRPFLLLEIAKQVRKRMPAIAFVVVGDGPQLHEMKRAVKRERLTKTVYFPGRQADMRPWYKDSSLTLICSLKEGLALTAYESLSMGTPVITSDVGGQGELIDDTVGRLLPLMQSEEEDLDKREFEEEEILQYVNAVVDLLKDRQSYRNMCKACRNRILEHFSTRLMIQRMETALEGLPGKEKEERAQAAIDMGKYGSLASELAVLYSEITSYEAMYKGNISSEKDELLRLVNSKLGKKLLKLFFALRLNALFR